MKDSENRISFIKDIEITHEKAGIIYSALSNEIEKCGRVESLSRFGSDWVSVILDIKKLPQNLKGIIPPQKYLSTVINIDLPQQCSLSTESIFLMKNNKYLIYYFNCSLC